MIACVEVSSFVQIGFSPKECVDWIVEVFLVIIVSLVLLTASSAASVPFVPSSVIASLSSTLIVSIRSVVVVVAPLLSVVAGRVLVLPASSVSWLLVDGGVEASVLACELARLALGLRGLVGRRRGLGRRTLSIVVVSELVKPA